MTTMIRVQVDDNVKGQTAHPLTTPDGLLVQRSLPQGRAWQPHSMVLRFSYRHHRAAACAARSGLREIGIAGEECDCFVQAVGVSSSLTCLSLENWEQPVLCGESLRELLRNFPRLQTLDAPEVWLRDVTQSVCVLLAEHAALRTLSVSLVELDQQQTQLFLEGVKSSKSLRRVTLQVKDAATALQALEASRPTCSIWCVDRGFRCKCAHIEIRSQTVAGLARERTRTPAPKDNHVRAADVLSQHCASRKGHSAARIWLRWWESHRGG